MKIKEELGRKGPKIVLKPVDKLEKLRSMQNLNRESPYQNIHWYTYMWVRLETTTLGLGPILNTVGIECGLSFLFT